MVEAFISESSSSPGNRVSRKSTDGCSCDCSRLAAARLRRLRPRVGPDEERSSAGSSLCRPRLRAARTRTSGAATRLEPKSTTRAPRVSYEKLASRFASVTRRHCAPCESRCRRARVSVWRVSRSTTPARPTCERLRESTTVNRAPTSCTIKQKE